MNSDKPTLSLVIVSWNTEQLVLDCLNSLESSRAHLPVEIVLVDNASKDGTVESVRERFPHVKIILNEENLGFAKANNAGIAVCSGKYVALINSDVVVPEDCLEKMVDYMEQHRDIGMLGPKMILRDGTQGSSVYEFPTVGIWLSNALGLNFVIRKLGFMSGKVDYDKIQDVGVLTGWFWMIRREAIDQVGVLDDQFFMYGEDIDWPKRFHKSGWRVVFYPEAQAIHYCGASSALAPTRFYVEMNRANLQYFRKHHGWRGAVGFWLAMWLHQVVRIIGYCFVYPFRPSDHVIIAHKVKRSVACLLWLMGLKAPSEAR
jgi:GT2 family glycosyltransferase